MVVKSKLKYIFLVVGFVLLFVGLNDGIFIKKNSAPKDGLEQHLINEIEGDLNRLSSKIEHDFRLIESKNTPMSGIGTHKPDYVSYFKLFGSKLIDWDGFEYNLPESIRGVKFSDYKSFENQQGVFLVKKHFTTDGFELVALVPIHRIYSLENKFLNEDVDKDFIGRYNVNVFITANKGTVRINNKLGKGLFYISKNNLTGGVGSIDWAQTLMLIVGFLLLSIALYLFYVFFESRSQYVYNFIFLIVFLFLFRVILLLEGFPNSVFELEWFKSNYFASSILFPSFGDFVINLLIFIILGSYFFLRLDKDYLYKKIIGKSKKQQWGLLVALVFVLNIILYLYYLGVFVLHKDAQWNFDISKSVVLNYYTISYLLIFVFLSIATFLYTYFVLRLWCVLYKGLNVSLLRFLLLSIIVLLFNFILGVSWSVFSLFYAYVFAVVYFKLYSGLKNFNFKSYLFLILSAFSFSLMGSFVLLQNSEISEEINKKKYATKVLDNSELELEYLLGNVSNGLKKDSVVLKTLPSIWTTKDVILSTIKNEYLGREFERYEIDIHLFDKFGNGYFKNTVEDSYFELRRKFAKHQYITSTPNLYHLSTYSGMLQDKYIQFVQIKIQKKVVGYIVLELALKKIKEHSLYPLLVNNYETNKQLLLSGYDFAIYEKGVLVFNHGSYQYPKKIGVFVTDFSFNENGFNHYQTKRYKSKQIVISSPNNVFTVFMANFSYLFIVLVFCVFLALLLVSLFNQKKLSNFSTKIQIYLNLACFLPLIVVSISTMSVINDNYKEDLNNTFISKAQSIGANIDEYVDRYENKQIAVEELEMVLNKMSEYTVTDINLYGIDGDLVLSSQKSLFELGLLSDLINPIAKMNLQNQKNVMLLNEKIGNFEYQSVYLSLQSPNTGKQIGLISIPFFNSERELNSKRIAVLSTYMNIFSVAFLLILLLSQLAYNSITNPLRFIADKLKRISFTGVNEELDWSSEDEIGLLVNEYNNMLNKLEESKKALSQSEKEFAWREMAQQVAHEIKNPLTPMKLSMQHMRRVGVDDAEKLRSSIDSMLTQIDILNDIASSFSAFAKMPIPESKEYDIKTVFKEIISLYDNEDVDLVYSMPDEEPILLIGDAKVMGRILTNLVLNGIQSFNGEGLPKIELHLVASTTDILIEVKDNGAGIPTEIQAKVFMPNFSTKYTGSGIGLAVAKRGVEHAQGNIWFDTKEEEGTTFFIKLPRLFKLNSNEE